MDFEELGGKVREPDGKIDRVCLYEDRTNELVYDFCDGRRFDDYDALERMLEYVYKAGCNRIKVVRDVWDGDPVTFYYRRENKWIRVPNSTCTMDLDEARFWFAPKISYTLGCKSMDSDLEFWEKRKKIRLMLRDLKPFPNGLDSRYASYAEVSYDITKAIEGLTDEKTIMDAITAALRKNNWMELTEDEKKLVVAGYLREEYWHTCPVCEKYIFRSEHVKCPICGWNNNSQQEYEMGRSITSENTEPLVTRKLYYKLCNNIKTSEEACRIWQEYRDVFDALIKVKKAFPKEQEHPKRYSVKVLVDGVNIDDGCGGEFGVLRDKLYEDLRKLGDELDHKTNEQVSEKDITYTEFNHPGRDKCDQLREIRKKIAEENGIDYTPQECHHTGSCTGTCPACEAEVKYLEEQLAKKRGKIKLVGIAEEFMQDKGSTELM